jgi:hypothetical protein
MGGEVRAGSLFEQISPESGQEWLITRECENRKENKRQKSQAETEKDPTTESSRYTDVYCYE